MNAIRGLIALLMVVLSTGLTPVSAGEHSSGTPVPVQTEATTGSVPGGDEPGTGGEHAAPEADLGTDPGTNDDRSSGPGPVEDGDGDPGTNEAHHDSEPAPVPQRIEVDAAPAADVASMGSKTIYADTVTPSGCSTTGWAFAIQPNPGPDVQAISVTFTNGNTVEAGRVTGPSSRANFRTATNRDSTVASASAVVDAGFEPTSFRVTGGPCNPEPVPGEYAVTIRVATNDRGSAAGARVTVTRNDGTMVAEGDIGPDNNFDAGRLADGGYTVEIDGWPAEYNRVARDFTVSNAARTIDISLARLTGGAIEVQVQETREFGFARIQGASVTVEDMYGETTVTGVSGETGVFRTETLPPSIYAVTVDGRAVGFATWTGTVSTETKGHVTGVVLERLPDEAPVTIFGDTWDGGGAEGARVSVKGPGSVEILSGTLDANNRFDAGVLPNGRYSVTVDAWSLGLPYMYGFVSSFEVAGEPIEVRVPLNQFPTNGSFSGSVQDDDTGAFMRGVDVVVTDPDGNTWSASTGSTGRFRITRLTQGVELTLTIEAEGYEPFSATHTLPPTAGGQGRQWTIRLQPFAQQVTITATTDDGGSAEGARVTIENGGDDDAGIALLAILGEGVVDADNRFTTDALPIGEYTVTIDGTAQGYGVASGTFSVPVDGPVDVALARVAGAVSVTMESGDPELADTLPEGAAWAIIANGGVVDSGVFLPEHRTLPVTIPVTNLVPFGAYTVVIDAAPVFEPFIETFTVDAAEQTFAIVLAPVPPAPTTGYALVEKRYCEDIDAVIFGGEGGEGCATGAAAFTFSPVSDDAVDPELLELDDRGIGSIELAPGEYEVVEVDTQARTTISVTVGTVTELLVRNPAAEVDPTPVDPPVDPTPTVTPVPSETPEPTQTPKPDEDTTGVVELPKVGSGEMRGAGLLMAASALGALLAAAGAFRLRRGRS